MHDNINNMGANSEEIQSLETNVKSWSTWLDLFTCPMFLISSFTDTVTSPGAWFNDTRCLADGVCSTDPLLFTCELKEVFFIGIVLPSGKQEFASYLDTPQDISLPTGFTAVSFVVRVVNESMNQWNFSLTMLIEKAYLLDGGEIRCDDTTLKNVQKARCPLFSK